MKSGEKAAEEITLRRMPPPRGRFTRLEALRVIEKSPLRFTRSWDQVKGAIYRVNSVRSTQFAMAW